MLESWTSIRKMNVVLISLAFLFTFASFGTIAGLQKVILKNTAGDSKSQSLDGYSLAAVITLAYSVFLIPTPYLLSVVGNRATLLIGAATFLVYGFILLSRNVWISNILSILSGAGNAVMWVAENNYIVLNAHDDTLMSDISLFWIFYSSSMLIGSTFVAIKFNGVTNIDEGLLMHLFYVASGSVCLGIMFLLCLKKPQGSLTKGEPKKPKTALMDLFNLLKMRKMGLFYCLFIFNGFQQAFGVFVYNACVAFTKAFGGMSTQLAPLSAITYSSGMCFAGIISIPLSKLEKKIRNYHSYVFWSSITIMILSLAGVFINLANDSPFAPTDKVSFVAPMIWLTQVCSFGIGVSDGLTSTQIWALLGRHYPDHSAESTVCYKITKSASISLFLLIVKCVGLHGQLLLLAFVGLVSGVAFFTIERQKSTVKNGTT